jgi:hypothetical protein
MKEPCPLRSPLWAVGGAVAGDGREALGEVDVGPNNLARCRRRAMLTSPPVMAPAGLVGLAAGCFETLPLSPIAMPDQKCFGGNFGF